MQSRHAAFMALIALAMPGMASASAIGRYERGERTRATGTRDMARLPAGTYRPLYTMAGEVEVRVAAFALDRRPVTRGEFLAFVRMHPAWRRDSVRPLLAEPSYLAQWPGVLDAGSRSDLQRPATGVSWFAATAYCATRGKRLPTLDEWEYAAVASATRRDATSDLAFRRTLLELYAARSPARLPIAGLGAANVYGIRDLHGSAWEWTRDFNSSHRLYCASGAIGAADPTNYPAFMRSALRAGLTPRSTLDKLGFRCAADLPA